METTGLPSRIASALATVAHYSPLHQGLSLFEPWLDTVNTVMGARDAAVAPTPKEVIWRKNKARLYRYTRSEKVTKRTPVLCIMPLINRAYILDLRPGASFVA
jgi:polyhydroxyalkanoate synthase